MWKDKEAGRNQARIGSQLLQECRGAGEVGLARRHMEEEAKPCPSVGALGLLFGKGVWGLGSQ